MSPSTGIARIIPAPRQLPLTIAAMTLLLVLKSVALVRGWSPSPPGLGMVTAAHASAPEKHEKPESHQKPREAAVPIAPAPPQPAPPMEPEQKPVSESERAILLELRQRRLLLDKRDAAVTAREQVLKAAEQKIALRLEEMRALQQRLESYDTARKQQEDASWQGLVKLYETMKPHEAATIYNELAMSVLLPLVAHMKEAKAAPILAAMNPEKARELTSQLAKTRTRPEPPPGSSPQSASPPKPKG